MQDEKSDARLPESVLSLSQPGKEMGPQFCLFQLLNHIFWEVKLSFCCRFSHSMKPLLCIITVYKQLIFNSLSESYPILTRVYLVRLGGIDVY